MYADNAANSASLSSLNETAQANKVPAISIIRLFGGGTCCCCLEAEPVGSPPATTKP